MKERKGTVLNRGPQSIKHTKRIRDLRSKRTGILRERRAVCSHELMTDKRTNSQNDL